MNSRFLSNLNDKDKKDLEYQIKHGILGKALKDYLDKAISQVESSERTFRQFETPNWSYHQAYRNGELTRLMEIRKLLGE